MTDLLATLFINGIADPSGMVRQLLMPPLCLMIAVVYKTIRCSNVRDIPMASVVLCITIMVGMYVVGLGLWALFTIMA